MWLFLSAAVLISMEGFRAWLEDLFAVICVTFNNHSVAIIFMILGMSVFLNLAYLMEGNVPPPPLKTNKTQEPKWQVFKKTNYAFVVLFVNSLTYVLVQSKEASNRQALILAYVVMGGSLAYFFGFFGVTFVSEEANASTTTTTTTATKGSTGSNTTTVCAAAAAAAGLDDETIDPLSDLHLVSDEDVLELLKAKKLSVHLLEKRLSSNMQRAVALRRLYYQDVSQRSMAHLPYEDFAYEKAYGRNCEAMIGYVQIPVGMVGPLLLNQQELWFPMATTEGCLVASTNRGVKAMNTSPTGTHATILRDGITRAPCVRFGTAAQAAEAGRWLESADALRELQNVFDTTTRFGTMTALKVIQASRNLYLRISCQSGDAMGMNMVSKGTMAILDHLTTHRFKDAMEIVCVSGNVCTDKKPAAINWIEGRGKSVVCETTIPSTVVTSVLKSSVDAMVDVHIQKNLIGSAMAGAIGGCNAHAANLVAAVFLATGQDPAQVVESANCLTHAERTSSGDLYMSVTMPSIEVGTVGGGTHLPAQTACLTIIGASGPSKTCAGENARHLAKVVAAAVLAGEVSLLAALAAGDLVKSHMEHNRA